MTVVTGKSRITIKEKLMAFIIENRFGYGVFVLYQIFFADGYKYFSVFRFLLYVISECPSSVYKHLCLLTIVYIHKKPFCKSV